MMKVGVWLKDVEFARVLMRGLAAEGRNIYFAVAGEDCEETDYDLFLTEHEPENSRQICLVSNPEEERIHEGPPYRIFRYQDANTFVRNLLLIYYCETGRTPTFTGDIQCRILAFTSLGGGVKATALALATGEILYKHFGYRCLYLNLCPIDGSKCFLPGGSSKGLLTLLYYLDQEKDFPLESFIRMNLHVDHIDTTIFNPYFDELSVLQTQRLLKKIDQLGKYSYLILDMGNHLSRNNKALLAHAEEVVLVTGNVDVFPAPFFTEVIDLLENLAGDTQVKRVSFDMEKSDEASLPFLQENEMLDLSAMKTVQWEAGRLVKGMMEHADD